MSDFAAQRRLEAAKLKRQALQLGIDVYADPRWWWEDVENFSGDLQMWELVKDEFTYLTELGESAIRKRIADEQRRLEEQARQDVEWRRKNTQWRLTVIGTVIGWIMGLAGILIAVITVLKK